MLFIDCQRGWLTTRSASMQSTIDFLGVNLDCSAQGTGGSSSCGRTLLNQVHLIHLGGLG